MKNICNFFLFVFVFLTINFTIAQERIHTYFDVNGTQIEETDYANALKDKIYLSVHKNRNDSVFHKLLRLDKRNRSGKLDNSTVEKIFELYPSENGKPIVIQFHPGLDKCNEHYTTRTNEMIKFLKNRDENILKKTSVHPYSIYKDNNGVEKLSTSLNWRSDKDHLIENLFFDYHYPCGSYVVINTKGEYLAFYGEYYWKLLVDDYQKLK